MRQLNWVDLRLFKQPVEAGTVRQAGEQLGISHSTVARRNDQLEKTLGVLLVSRIKGEYVLTDVGDELMELAHNITASVSQLERRALGQTRDVEGEVRLTMIDAMAHSPVMQALKEFSATHAQIHLELDLRNNPADLDQREADVALRFSAGPDEHLIGKKLLNVGTAAYCSTIYANRFRDESPDFSPQWVGFQPRRAKGSWRQKTPFPRAPIVGTIASQAGQLAACKAGMGLASLPCFMAEDDPDLERVSDVRHPPHYTLWLLKHPDLRGNARVQLLSDELSNHFRTQKAAYVGPVDQPQG